jgi:uncharacterized protein YjbI with pentapeptide repeats
VGVGKHSKKVKATPSDAQDCSYIGSWANLQGCNLTNADLNDADLTNADLVDADLPDAILSGVNLAGTDLSNATLSGVSSGGITGTPSALPTGWLLADGYLVGPQANLTNADLVDADLSNANLAGSELSNATLSGVSSGGITGTPSALPTGWLLADGYLVGPQANLTNADLVDATVTDSDLDGTDLSGADLTGVSSGDITGFPAYLPSGWNVVSGYLVGPSANLSSADLAGANLASANLSDANFTDADLDNANLTSADLSDANWSNTTCPDGTNSNADENTCDSDLAFHNGDWTAQNNLDEALTDADTDYQQNGDTFPSSAAMIAALAAQDPGLTFTPSSSTAPGTISVFTSADQNGLILAAYSPSTENCWYVYDDQGEVLDEAPWGSDPTGSNATPVVFPVTTAISVPTASDTYYAEVKGDDMASDCSASQPIGPAQSTYVFQTGWFPDL